MAEKKMATTIDLCDAVRAKGWRMRKLYPLLGLLEACSCDQESMEVLGVVMEQMPSSEDELALLTKAKAAFALGDWPHLQKELSSPQWANLRRTLEYL